MRKSDRTTKDTKHALSQAEGSTKVKNKIFRTLRVLGIFIVESFCRTRKFSCGVRQSTATSRSPLLLLCVLCGQHSESESTYYVNFVPFVVKFLLPFGCGFAALG